MNAAAAPAPRPIDLDGRRLSIESVLDIALRRRPVRLDPPQPYTPPSPALAAPATATAPSLAALGVDLVVDAPDDVVIDLVEDAIWVAPVDGACPEGFPIKAKLSSGIFHQPGGAAYARTKPDRCYASADDALLDGLRAAKR